MRRRRESFQGGSFQGGTLSEEKRSNRRKKGRHRKGKRKFEYTTGYIDGMSEFVRHCEAGNITEALEYLGKLTLDEKRKGFSHCFYHGHRELIRLLIYYGFDYWQRAMYGACAGSQVCLVRFLMKEKKESIRINKQVIECACRVRNMEIIHILLEHGSLYTRRKIFKRACYYGLFDLVMSLMHTLELKDHRAGMVAAIEGQQLELVKALNERGVAIDLIKLARTALLANSVYIMKFFIWLGYKVTEQDIKFAESYKYTKMHQLLLSSFSMSKLRFSSERVPP